GPAHAATLARALAATARAGWTGGARRQPLRAPADTHVPAVRAPGPCTAARPPGCASSTRDRPAPGQAAPRRARTKYGRTAAPGPRWQSRPRAPPQLPATPGAETTGAAAGIAAAPAARTPAPPAACRPCARPRPRVRP